mmetsp:Transcript_6329/g.13093  ORF Transcript_6329/g.13093 Transcript_6329/m.13093 type:complete len:529 (+) Transcript_6329:224-1810(+)|eukprot:CAMPEP_0201128826 /NCGR_PEP_ID=MMETSP0850-20130426/34941_1 /ASSEMBLY_ACC=CAM_ASM_000622 /TAXON_ID=183588 /ORGANISM="Pseudo-nitzschia fraudulenta, Strain WWA7" /LENGTH=528 /DNA_ID=CAMNT_0047398123 /DNA_START=77 /DNA_END=1663 /DNA_ORIENTATION=-
MLLRTKYQLVAVLWVGSSFTVLSAFQQPLNAHNTRGIRPSSKTTTTTLYDVPEPLAEEDTWQAYLDEETTGLVYYFDTATGESRWEPPTTTFPAVRLPRRKQRLADSLRRDYRKTRQEMADGAESEGVAASEGGMGGIFSTVTSVLERETPVQEEAEAVDETPVQEDEQPPAGGWFNNFFSDSGADKQTTEEPSLAEESLEEEEQVQATTGIFGSIFGGGSASVEVEDKGAVAEASPEDDMQEEENKNGLLDSFTSPFMSSPKTENVAERKAEEKIVATTPQPIKIEIGSHILPHPAKVRWGGEDATFVKGRTFGVFDGVSGAEKLDGVPLYSRTLASEMRKMCGTSGETVQDMTTYLTSAASYADGAATGASTAVVASIGENGFLQALNVGDSCCMVVRDGKVTAKTREISHYWECPYQLSEDSPDQPKDGTKLNVELIAGDLIIMGSDGVFDNVDDDSLLDLVGKSSVIKPTPLAKRICDLSRKVSLDKTSVTPYSKQAQRRGDADYRDGLGGKVDDVSCVVVVCK